MGRATVCLRAAGESDAEALAQLWADVLRRGSVDEQVADARAIIAAAVASDHACVVVAEIDGRVAGSVHLKATTLSPVNLEPVVQALAPHVHPEHRRRGVGTALMDAAVTFAEERQIGLVAAAAISASRDSNRFFARLSMGARATLRIASTHTVRQRLLALRSERGGPPGNRQLDKVLAARRVRRGDRVL